MCCITPNTCFSFLVQWSLRFKCSHLILHGGHRLITRMTAAYFPSPSPPHSPTADTSQHHYVLVQFITLRPTCCSVNAARFGACRIMLGLANQWQIQLCLAVNVEQSFPQPSPGQSLIVNYDYYCSLVCCSSRSPHYLDLLHLITSAYYNMLQKLLA